MDIPKGRVETLTSKEEYLLKEVWLHLFHYFGYNVTLPSKAKLQPTHSLHRNLSLQRSVSNHSHKSGRFKTSKKKHPSKAAVEREISDRSECDMNIRTSALAAIKEIVKGIPPEDVERSFWSFLRTDSPDNLLLRFIRARKFNLEASLKMIFNTLYWRIKVKDVDEFFLAGELEPFLEDPDSGFIRQFKKPKSVIQGIDKLGRPIVVVRPNFHFSNDQTQEEMERYTLLVIEYARLFLKDPVDTCSILFDLSQFSLKNMDYAPVKFMIQCFEAHYPESLGVVMIYKAPIVFSGIWSIVRKWLDPVVAAKINFSKNVKELSRYVTLDNIPKHIGGESPIEYEYLEPSENANGHVVDDETKDNILRQRNELIAEFRETTLEWIASVDHSKGGKLLKEKIALGKRLAHNYVELDPYVRNRSFYDRRGDLPDFNPEGIELIRAPTTSEDLRINGTNMSNGAHESREKGYESPKQNGTEYTEGERRESPKQNGTKHMESDTPRQTAYSAPSYVRRGYAPSMASVATNLSVLFAGISFGNDTIEEDDEGDQFFDAYGGFVGF